MNFFFGIISVICTVMAALQFRHSGTAGNAREDITALELGTVFASVALILAFVSGRWPWT